jgi:F-type H+-transporting ATPase subunit delta
MNTSSIGTRYAKSIFLLAKEQQTLDQVKEDMEFIYSSFRDSKDISLILENPVANESLKLSVIKELFRDKVGDLVINLLIMVINNNREKYIEAICRNFFDLYKKYKGIKTVMLTSATPLEKGTRVHFIEILKKQLRSEIDFTEKVNEKLLGGFILQIDGKHYDSSISHKLNRVKKELTQRK